MFGNESDDDDCKYHLKWSATPICEGSPGVIFTVFTTHKIDSVDGSAGSPLTGANPGWRKQDLSNTGIDFLNP